MRTLIHRSSALRASTDAYGAGILADAGVLSEPVYWGWTSDSSDKTARPAGHPQGVPPRRLAHCLIGRGDALSDKSDGADERGA